MGISSRHAHFDAAASPQQGGWLRSQGVASTVLLVLFVTALVAFAAWAMMLALELVGMAGGGAGDGIGAGAGWCWRM